MTVMDLREHTKSSPSANSHSTSVGFLHSCPDAECHCFDALKASWTADVPASDPQPEGGDALPVDDRTDEGCIDCGYEVPPGRERCDHCGALNL